MSKLIDEEIEEYLIGFKNEDDTFVYEKCTSKLSVLSAKYLGNIRVTDDMSKAKRYKTTSELLKQVDALNLEKHNPHIVIMCKRLSVSTIDIQDTKEFYQFMIDSN